MSDVANTVAAQNRIDLLLEEFRARWRSGDRPGVESYLGSALDLDDEEAALLVFEEYRIRVQRGETATLEDYRRQFPRLAAHLTLLAVMDDVFAPPAPKSPRPGLPTVPGYEILAELGRGGMGIVYKARQLSLDRIVALKLLHAHLVNEPEFLTRFQEEASAAAKLRDANIVTVYENGDHQGQPFLTMEYVAGTTLAKRLAEAPLTADDAADLLEVIARAAHHAHESGVVHRDLKPLNILLAADLKPKIVDFGLAKRFDAPSNTRTGQILGTPAYMAPEAVGGGCQSGRGLDVYALGAILYECLTGRPPFKAATPLETLAQVKNDEPAPPSQLNHSVPRDLETICLKCLAKAPGERYASAADLADDLGRFRHREPIHARPVGWLGRGQRWSRRNPLPASLLLLLAVLVAASGSGLTVLWRRAVDSANREAGARINAEQSEEDAHELLADFIRLGQEPKPASFAASHARQIELLRRTETHCRKSLARQEADQGTRVTLVVTHARLALVYLETMFTSDAETCLHAAEADLNLLPADAPNKTDTLRRLANGYDQLGDMCVNRWLWPEAVRAFKRSHALRVSVAGERPTLEDRMALQLSSVWARSPQVPDQISARQLTTYDRAVREWLEPGQERNGSPELLASMAKNYLLLGNGHDQAGHAAEAEGCWRIAYDAAGKLCAPSGGTAE